MSDSRIAGSNLAVPTPCTAADRRLPLEGSVALVAGASSGIGRAIAIELAKQGAILCAVGRDRDRLQEAVTAAAQYSRAIPFRADLCAEGSIPQIAETVRQDLGRLDILVHSSGIIYHNRMSQARIEDLDAQYLSDLRVPYLLTQALLPELKATQGQVVFINSTLGLNAKRPEAGQYAATQHALKAVADSLREEVNPDGIRVLTVFSGRTATRRQHRLRQQEGQAYSPELLMQPEDVAKMVLAALMLARTAEVTEISMRPLIKSY